MQKYNFTEEGSKKVKIRSFVTNLYVCSENGKKAMTCNRKIPQGWEVFDLITLENGKYAFRGNNGKYVCSENGQKSMSCDRSEINEWEMFSILHFVGTDLYSILGNNGRFVSDENGKKPMMCDRKTPLEWERFYIEDV